MNFKKLSVKDIRTLKDKFEMSPAYLKEWKRYEEFYRKVNEIDTAYELNILVDYVVQFDTNLIADYLIKNDPCNISSNNYYWHNITDEDVKWFQERERCALCRKIEKEAKFIKWKTGKITPADKQRLLDIWNRKIDVPNFTSLIHTMGPIQLHRQDSFAKFTVKQIKEWIRFANFIYYLSKDRNRYELNITLLKTERFKIEDVMSYWEIVGKDMPENPDLNISYHTFIKFLTKPTEVTKNNKRKRQTK